MGDGSAFDLLRRIVDKFNEPFTTNDTDKTIGQIRVEIIELLMEAASFMAVADRAEIK